ncbi:MAG: AAA family ATPase [Chlamydiia bacterium]|nr:AAA family ATPase [Chlamydiia bacterium]
MEQITGREKEIKILQKLLDSNNPELLAVYGRRRVGKTYLISRFFYGKGLYFELTGINRGSRQEQLNQFSKAMSEAFPTAGPFPSPKSWFTAFDILREQLERHPKKSKIILFLDEFPWLATNRPSHLMKAFEHVWNRYFSRMPNIKVVICGSAASWMIKKVINNKGGLYGRLTQKMHLQPLTLYETELYLQSNNVCLDRKQITDIYMTIGGIPKYLNFIEQGLSSAQITYSLCFSPFGYLKTEFLQLFESLFDNHKTHMSVVRALAKKHQGLTFNELAKTIDVKSGGFLTEILDELELSGFVQFISFFGKKKREGQYRLIDEYSLFYLTWVEPNQNHPCTEDYWLRMQRSPRYLSWAGYAFENICIKYADMVARALNITVITESYSHWFHRPDKNKDARGAQIDLVIDRKDQTVNLCEIKFCEKEYEITKDYAAILNNRRATFREVTKTRKSIFNTIITPFGAKQNAAYLSCVDNQVDMSALFVKI